jgi:PAS domain S-box-containing protein
VKSLTNPIVRAWKWWFTPHSTDPTVVYRERALRFLLPIIALLRALAIANVYFGFGENVTPPRFISLQLSILIFVVPFIFSVYFLVRKQINMAGACFLLSWYLIDMSNLPADGYWLPNFQISLIIEVILGALFLPARAILPFMIFQLVTVGMWGNWLDVNYYDSPLLSTGMPVAVFDRTIYTLAVQEFIIAFIVRYLRLQMEKSLRLQQVTIKQLQAEVTERKQAELALQQLDNMYRRAIDAAGAVPYVLSHRNKYDFTFAFIGEGILSMTGYSATEMTSDLWNSLILNAFPRGRLSHLTFEEADRITNEDHSILWECDFLIRTRDGQARWIADTSVKGFDEQDEGLISIGIYQDITERKRAEEIREKLIGELEQRNAELERLAYTLSHELKSPLVTIRGFLGYLREDALNRNMERLDVDIQRITDGSEKMLGLINELIDLMGVGRIIHEFKEIPLRTLVEEALEFVHEEIARKNIVVQIADNLPHVHGDHKRLVEVLQNLLENSIKFMGEQPQPKIEIGQRYEQGVQVFYICDNGIGVDPRFAERIFGIFHKLDVNSEGTGIGLALAKRIIEVHGGRIWVESEGLGKGSTFCFTIPDGRKREN